MNRQISKDGTFHKFRMTDGKAYIYNADGMLIRIAIYKDSHYVGDEQIEPEK